MYLKCLVICSWNEALKRAAFYLPENISVFITARESKKIYICSRDVAPFENISVPRFCLADYYILQRHTIYRILSFIYDLVYALRTTALTYDRLKVRICKFVRSHVALPRQKI